MTVDDSHPLVCLVWETVPDSQIWQKLCVFPTDSYKLLVYNTELNGSSCMSEASAGCCNKYWAAENCLQSGFRMERWTCLDYITRRPILLLIIAADTQQARRAALLSFIMTA